MNNCRIFLIFHFTTLFGFVISLENKSRKNTNAGVPNSLLSVDSFHEESHSQNVHPTTVKHMVTNNATSVASNSPHKTALEFEKKSFLNTNKTYLANNKGVTDKYNFKQVESAHTIPTEGGTIDLHVPSKQQAGKPTVAGSSTERYSISHANHEPVEFNKTFINIPKVISNSKPTHLIKEESPSSEKPKSKRIHGRPGVDFGPETPLPVSSTPIPKQKKPLFTMITGDKESKESESFIESPTTGRDYVLPMVLIILSLPILGYIIKLIYKRGTEFSERQQYHRMYLIDGMYNSR